MATEKNRPGYRPAERASSPSVKGSTGRPAARSGQPHPKLPARPAGGQSGKHRARPARESSAKHRAKPVGESSAKHRARSAERSAAPVLGDEMPTVQMEAPFGRGSGDGAAAESDSQEKRTSPRRLVLLVSELAAGTRHAVVAVTQDISATGLSFGTPVRLLVGSRARVRPLFGDRGAPFQELVGRVVRVEEKDAEDNPLWRFLVAIKFDRPLEETCVDATAFLASSTLRDTD